MVVTDILGNPLRANDLIAYPTRSGSTMHQVVARIIQVREFPDGNPDAWFTRPYAEMQVRPLQRDGRQDPGARLVTIKSLERVVKVLKPVEFG